MNSHRVLFLTDNRDTAAVWLSSMGQSSKVAITIAHRCSIATQVVVNFGIIIIEVETTKPLETLKLCQRLRSQTDGPILVLSSFVDEEYEIEVYKAGADDYLVTPIGADLLRAKLQAWQRWVVPATIWSWSMQKNLLT